MGIVIKVCFERLFIKRLKILTFEPQCDSLRLKTPLNQELAIVPLETNEEEKPETDAKKRNKKFRNLDDLDRIGSLKKKRFSV
jgi:hypothetical protein